MDSGCVEKLITPRTSGIIGVHVWGEPCDIESLAAIAQRRNLKLLFDAAHAFGCTHHGRAIGGFGSAEVFSFHATKFLNTFEGGMIATNDDELAKKIRLMTNFGFAGYDNVIYVGTNGKMHEASAAMGLTNLEAIDEFIDCNRRNYLAYAAGFRGMPGIKLWRYHEHERRNYQYIPVEVDAALFGLTRDQLLDVLWAENVLARRYFFPGCHRMEPYRSYFPHAGLLLPNTERLCERILMLPTGTAMDEPAVTAICAIIGAAHGQCREISERLAAKHSLPTK